MELFTLSLYSIMLMTVWTLLISVLQISAENTPHLEDTVEQYVNETQVSTRSKRSPSVVRSSALKQAEFFDGSFYGDEFDEDGHLAVDIIKENNHGPDFQYNALGDAMGIVRRRVRTESRNAVRMNYVVDSMPFRFVSAFMNAKPYVKVISMTGASLLQTLKLIKYRHGANFDEATKDPRYILKQLPGVYHADEPLPVPPGMDYCPYARNYLCDAETQYRSYDGSCNNLERPLWGRSMIPYNRYLPAHYGDNIESMRTSVYQDYPLPGARHISLSVFPDKSKFSSIHTLVLMIWGQFIDHDITHTAITEVAKDNFDLSKTEEVKCGFDGCQTNQPGLEACWPIPVPRDDYDFRYNSCLKFVRSAEVPHISCRLKPREQINQVTSWLDASQVYGSTKEEAEKLRAYDSDNPGHLAVSRHPHGSFFKDLLPKDDVDLCRDVNRTHKCFAAGDERVNEQVGLTAMHTVWVREHNRIATHLSGINPHWHEERVYQETRRIISAMMQHIIYNELLPVILGPVITRKFGLSLNDDGYYYKYDSSADGRAVNEFATAAFRFGHTLIQDRFRRLDYNYRKDDSLMLSHAFRRPGPIYDTGRGGVDSLLRGLCGYPTQTFDPFFTKQISKNLFTENPPFGPGMDLLSLNIQRGRDHGIPGYNDYREYCGLKRLKYFTDLEGDVSQPAVIDILSKTYRDVDDIDLFVGGVIEISMPGGIVGPTFACLIATQFQNLRVGDRFWYERDGDTGFTPDQLQEIRKIRLSKVLCDNGDAMDVIQPWAMLRPFKEIYRYLSRDDYDARSTGMSFEDFSRLHDNDFNSRVSCDSLPPIDLSSWRHGPYTN